MLIGQFAGALLHFSIRGAASGQDESGELGLECQRLGYLALQFLDRHFAPELPIFLLALHAHPAPVLLAVNVHTGLRLPSAAILLCSRVTPDLFPEIKAQRLEGSRFVRRRQGLCACAHRYSTGQLKLVTSVSRIITHESPVTTLCVCRAIASPIRKPRQPSIATDELHMTPAGNGHWTHRASRRVHVTFPRLHRQAGPKREALARYQAGRATVLPNAGGEFQGVGSAIHCHSVIIRLPAIHWRVGE